MDGHKHNHRELKVLEWPATPAVPAAALAAAPVIAAPLAVALVEVVVVVELMVMAAVDSVYNR